MSAGHWRMSRLSRSEPATPVTADLRRSMVRQRSRIPFTRSACRTSIPSTNMSLGHSRLVMGPSPPPASDPNEPSVQIIQIMIDIMNSQNGFTLRK